MLECIPSEIPPSGSREHVGREVNYETIDSMAEA